MIKRILTASVLIACLIGFLFLREVNTLFFDALIFILAIGAMYELVSAFSKIDIKCNIISLIIYAVLYIASFYIFNILGIFVALLLGCIVALICFTFSTKQTILDLLATIFTMIYPSIFLYFGLYLNNLYFGLSLILLVILVSVLTDTFAYFVGSLIKGKKLCPKISPKKTISGAIGGLIGGIVGGILIYLCFNVWNLFNIFPAFESIWYYIIIGIVGAIFDEVGDLASSQIKRKTGIKDFGNIFPGHGGILDRIDGLSFVLAGVGIFVLQLMFIA